MTTVMCHGVFDLLHLGHIRHLREAASLGDRLVISVTSDRYVNKGAGRPRFSQEQRMEALKALSCVNEVILNDMPDPVALIEQVRPDFYVKGPDYVGVDIPELPLLSKLNIALHFTTAPKMSSSRLINQEQYGDEVSRYLETARTAGFLDRILQAFEAADQMEIAFVGERIIDHYRYVQALGKTSKEFVIATVETRDEVFHGGIAAAVMHGEWKKIDVVAPSLQITKTRFIDEDFSKKLFEVYSSRSLELRPHHRSTFDGRLHDAVVKSDAVVVFDFGHGLLTQQNRTELQRATYLAVNTQSNAGNYGYNLATRYPRAHLVCIDAPEARLAASNQHDTIERVTRDLSTLLIGSKIIVTMGKHGCIAFDPSKKMVSIPAVSQKVIDTMGAGDAFLAIAGPLAATGLPLEMAAFAGNVAGSIKVSILGHRSHVGRQELVRTIESLLK